MSTDQLVAICAWLGVISLVLLLGLSDIETAIKACSP